MRPHWLILSALGAGAALSVAPAAEAAQLNNWRFDASRNQLTFSTTASVQPTAKLIANPNRVVIDLPGTQLGRGTMRQDVGGTIASVRAGQFNANTARLVVELAPGYTLDPQQIRITGRTPTEWALQLPTPTRVVAASPTPSQPPARLPTTGDFQVTQNGLYWRLDQPAGGVNVQRVGSAMRIDLTNYRLPGEWANKVVPVNRYGVREARFQRLDSETTRVLLVLEPNSPDWYAALSGNGLAMVPVGGMHVLREVGPAPENSFPVAAQPQPQPQPPLRPTIEIPVPQPNPAPVPPPSVNPAPRPAPVPAPVTPNRRVLVTIDPGHGGRDPGAVGIGGLREKDVILPISQEVSRLLAKQGVAVRMTRSDDRFVTLQGRAQIANQAGSDLFVSIHANAATSSANGAETFHHPSSAAGRALAQSIQESMIRRTGLKNRGVKQANFSVLSNTNMPAALVEVGFVTGPQDAAKLRDPRFRQLMAEAIAEGILNYVNRRY
ncbi:N-acetylmuramoyl-L-alanine amidase [bacterium]|nr:N-acetylmuramoyl-L-alanine amidase [bacterium]